MKWETHGTISFNTFLLFTLAFWVTQPINDYFYFLIKVIFTGYLSYKFSVIPDKLERIGKKKYDKKKYVYDPKHRTWGHSVLIWLLCLAVFYFLKPFIVKLVFISTGFFKNVVIPFNIINGIYDVWLISFFVGWFSHLFCDSLHCGGIPMFYPLVKRRTPSPKLVRKYEDDENEIKLRQTINKVNYIFSAFLLIRILYPFRLIIIEFWKSLN